MKQKKSNKSDEQNKTKNNNNNKQTIIEKLGRDQVYMWPDLWKPG